MISIPWGRSSSSVSLHLILLFGRAEVLGRTTAFTKVTFYDKSNKVVAFGSHTKHMGNNKATKRFSEDGESELPLEGNDERSKL